VTRVFAHRGVHTTAHENSLEAFVAAIATGAHGVELDVRRTADGALVVHHDAVVEGVGAIAGSRVRDLPRSVPMLDEAMVVLEPIWVNIESKNDPDEPGYAPDGSLSHDVVTLLEERGDLERVIVSSFDLATLDAVRQASNAVMTGWLLGYAADVLASIDTAVDHGLAAVHPWVLSLDDVGVAAAHAAGLDVNTWTVNARHDLERMRAIDVDVVITDDVALALEVVAGA
jgi:glycerophosphoryl diester phosphodiesterase